MLLYQTPATESTHKLKRSSYGGLCFYKTPADNNMPRERETAVTMELMKFVSPDFLMRIKKVKI